MYYGSGLGKHPPPPSSIVPSLIIIRSYDFKLSTSSMSVPTNVFYLLGLLKIIVNEFLD
jgi:hypothetical protein